jgi:hypothetical protein
MSFGEKGPKRAQRGCKRQGRVRSYGPKRLRLLAFSRPATAAENVCIGGNGGEEGIRTLGTPPLQMPADVWSAMEWLADRQDSNGMICTSA